MLKATVWRRNGVGLASAAVAGVCLTSSVASAWTTTRATEFETEFEDLKELGAEPASARLGVAIDAASVEAAPSAFDWELALVDYLDRLANRNDEPTGPPADTAAVSAAAHAEVAQGDEVLAGSRPIPDASRNADPDWDLAEPIAALPIRNPDWDLEESTVAASPNPDWDLEEVSVAAKGIDSDWDLGEPAADGAVVAGAREESQVSPAARQSDSDWDIEEGAPASASAEASNADPADTDFDLIP